MKYIPAESFVSKRAAEEYSLYSFNWAASEIKHTQMKQ